jgi:hypothetical protein
LALGVVLACLAGRAYAQDGKVQTVGKEGLKSEGTVEGADDRVTVVLGDNKLRLPAKRYQLKLTGGTKYRLEMMSDDFDSFLVVQDDGGKQLAFDDDSGGNLNAKLDFTPPADGTYKVFAASLRGTGKYTLTVNPLGGGGGKPAEGKVYTIGKDGLKIEGKVEATDKRVNVRPPNIDKDFPMPAKLYQVKMNAGTKYEIIMRSDDFDSFLVIQDAGGKQLAFDDDSGKGNTGLDAKLDFAPQAGGTYKVFAASLKGTGKFILTIRTQGGGGAEKKEEKKEETKGDGVREVGKDGLSFKGTLDAANKNRVYQVKLVEGKTYVIDMTSPDTKALDPFLRLQDATGKQLAQDDDSGGGLNARIIFRAPATGTYRIVATSFLDAGRGEFNLTVREQ